MIDNIILLITGTLHQRQISELRNKCHPLGSFEEMESVNIANTPAELYSAVLVDTPLGTMYMCIYNVHVYIQCTCVYTMYMCIYNVHVLQYNILVVYSLLCQCAGFLGGFEGRHPPPP